MAADPQKIAAVLLAAGGSSRLGRPKQLVEFEGKTLIRRATENLIEIGLSPVFVVLGAEIEKSVAEVAGLPVEIVENDDWRDGMSTSIRSGLDRLGSIPAVDGILIALCDQPFVTTADLSRLVDAYRQHETCIAAAVYSERCGVPAVFPERLFAELRDLTGDKGARGLIDAHRDEVVAVEMDHAAIDIDSPRDLDKHLT